MIDVGLPELNPCNNILKVTHSPEETLGIIEVVLHLTVFETDLLGRWHDATEVTLDLSSTE